ncbi:MAG: HD domain-containing protein, partial [Syntrophorhabdales bacterium]
AVVPSLDCQRRIEDYDALIAPHRALIGKIGSLEALAELLRILYDGGEVPSVVSVSGKTYDDEYTKLREHKPFLEILEAVSLYDHTYNVLKAALDIAQNDLRRHGLFIPSIITAALAHDLGKIPSLWSASSLRKNGHEAVGAATLESLLVGHRNEEFTKSVVKAVQYHHANIETDTVARVILNADAKAREHEIIAADPRFTVKPLKDWLDLTRFAELLLPAVNQLTIKNRQARWNAISFQGVVYAMPNYVRHLLSRLAMENHIIDYRLVRASFPEDNRSVLADFANMLRARGLLAYRISEGYFGLKFLFRSSIPAFQGKGFLTIPIKAELFPVLPSELERSKTDYLKTIVSVKPAGGGY